MSDTIERLTGDDFQEAMDTMGEAFGFEPHRDFPMLLPQIYRPTDELMRAIYAIRRDGRIVSAVGVHPREWQVGDTTLKLAGIGGVCTLHDYRGQGLMKALMDRCVEDMKAEGYHLSWLGGQRQRYQYYGYEKCGTVYSFGLRRANVRHCARELPTLSFAAMGEYYADRIAVARGYHEAKPIHVLRAQEDFVLYLLSGHCEPWFALDADENVIGYLVTGSETTGIREIAARDVDTAMDMLYAWSDRVEKDLSVTVQPDDVPLSRALGDVAEWMNVSTSGNWQVYDWATTLEAMLAVKREVGGLAEGEVTVGIGDERFRMAVDGDGVSVTATDGEVDLAVSPFEAHRVFFGPVRPENVVAIPDSARVVAAWAPLPLGFMRGDSV